MKIDDLVFLIISGFTVASALGVVLSRNIVHSALALILTFIGVAMLFFGLGASFLGLVQILVYAGAVSVLTIFAIMLVMKPDPASTNPSTPSRATHILGGLLAWSVVVGLGMAIGFSRWPSLPAEPAGFDTVGVLANLLLGNYVVAFEAAAVLLLLAVVGAIILAKGAEKP
ncbi:MAG: NADH-quinone oxidoreductase subunit J [Syntrophomonadaceae bacterium]